MAARRCACSSRYSCNNPRNNPPTSTQATVNSAFAFFAAFSRLRLAFIIAGSSFGSSSSISSSPDLFGGFFNLYSAILVASTATAFDVKCLINANFSPFELFFMISFTTFSAAIMLIKITRGTAPSFSSSSSSSSSSSESSLLF